MVASLVLAMWLQLSSTAGIEHLPRLPAAARIVMNKKPSTKSTGGDTQCADAFRPTPLQIRRMLAGFHLEREGESESYSQYGCGYDGIIYANGKKFTVYYEGSQNLGTTWPDGKDKGLFGPYPDGADDGRPTKKEERRLRWYGIY